MALRTRNADALPHSQGRGAGRPTGVPSSDAEKPPTCSSRDEQRSRTSPKEDGLHGDQTLFFQYFKVNAVKAVEAGSALRTSRAATLKCRTSSPPPSLRRPPELGGRDTAEGTKAQGPTRRSQKKSTCTEMSWPRSQGQSLEERSSFPLGSGPEAGLLLLEVEAHVCPPTHPTALSLDASSWS